MMALLSSASRVEAPRCGSAMTPAWPSSSALGKSVTYHFSRWLFSPFTTASSATTPLREKLSSTAPAWKCSMFLASIMWRVFSPSGTCSETKWLCFSTSSTLEALRTCEGRLHAASTVMCGSWPSTFMPRRIAASATRLPILPRPMIPSVCPGSSEPANCLLPSSTCSSNSEEVFNPRTKSRAGARLRAARSMPARTSSFTALAFAPGALNTGTPRFDSVPTGMLFTPAPARPTALREGPNSCLCRSAERTRMACGSFASVTTAYCSAGKRFRPTWAMLFSTRISHFLARALAMLGFEFLHVLDEPLHSLQRHRVVDRRAHAADRTVPLQLDHATLGRPLQEEFIQGSVFQGKRHVHA